MDLCQRHNQLAFAVGSVKLRVTGREPVPDVAIVGGGVIGCVIAYELAAMGAEVELLERGEIGAESSGAAAGIMAPRVHASEPTLAAFALKSLQRFSALADSLREETGIDV